MNALVETPVFRLARTPRAWFAIGVWSAFAVVAGCLLRRANPPAGAGDVLAFPFAALALPLLVYATVGATLGRGSLSRSVRPLVAFGASPARAALGAILVAAALSATLSGLVSALVAVVAHGPSDPPATTDALASAWIAALGGAAYAGLFAFGASFGKHGGGRAVVLVLDWFLGDGDGLFGVLTPRAHVRSLLGGEATASLSNGGSVVALALLAIGFAMLATLRARR